MSYQTEEVVPMLDGNKTSKNPNQWFGLAAFMVLCVAATSFMAGHAYGSSATATASALRSSTSDSCNNWRSFHMAEDCNPIVYDCLYDAWYGGGAGPASACLEDSSSSRCEW
eukprot:CAMPEP_0168180824 /NCGR_PEP_ID=MMETSP0139_2-20121125/10797_1 /TAXON_ID=44445 /ORGANISM="Pseudo-nitzschia australis, Strain 10249 10 AB" /LENGTH=111 /DNA_ID=CAMNT_0008101175 /DNA_START=294 /DNA_END=626 /DNA_ORIENTATION=+